MIDCIRICCCSVCNYLCPPKHLPEYRVEIAPAISPKSDKRTSEAALLMFEDSPSSERNYLREKKHFTFERNDKTKRTKPPAVPFYINQITLLEEPSHEEDFSQYKIEEAPLPPKAGVPDTKPMLSIDVGAGHNPALWQQSKEHCKRADKLAACYEIREDYFGSPVYEDLSRSENI